MTLLSDAARPLRRALHLVTCQILDGEHTTFDFVIPGPAVFRHAYARELAVKSLVIGGKNQQGVLVVLVFEIDPVGQPTPRRYYLLPFGAVTEGAAVAEMMYVATATLPNGAPIAVYEMPPRAM